MTNLDPRFFIDPEQREEGWVDCFICGIQGQAADMLIIKEPPYAKLHFHRSHWGQRLTDGRILDPEMIYKEYRKSVHKAALGR